MDYDKERKRITDAMTANAQKQVELTNEMTALQKEFRSLDLREHQDRAKISRSEPEVPLYTLKVPPRRVPTGIKK